MDRVPKIRTFETGATRNLDTGKHDFRGYLSPRALHRFAEYMTTHRLQADGTIRASDNWKKGIPKQEYLSSALRHMFDVWLLHEGQPGIYTQNIEEALCGLFFNIQGYLHETVKPQEATITVELEAAAETAAIEQWAQDLPRHETGHATGTCCHELGIKVGGSE